MSSTAWFWSESVRSRTGTFSIVQGCPTASAPESADSRTRFSSAGGGEALTDLGQSLIEPIIVLGDWAEINVDRIVAAQGAYDARESR